MKQHKNIKSIIYEDAGKIFEIPISRIPFSLVVAYYSFVVFTYNVILSALEHKQNHETHG